MQVFGLGRMQSGGNPVTACTVRIIYYGTVPIVMVLNLDVRTHSIPYNLICQMLKARGQICIAAKNRQKSDVKVKNGK